MRSVSARRIGLGVVFVCRVFTTPSPWLVLPDKVYCVYTFTVG